MHNEDSLMPLVSRHSHSHSKGLTADTANPVDLALGEAYEEAELSEEDLLITPTVIHGFSLSDKLWRA